MPTEIPEPQVTATYDRDILRCGGCGGRMSRGLGPVSEGAVSKCPSRNCGMWNAVPLRAAAR